MKASIIILATLMNIFFIHPSVQAKLMYTNQWECMIEILFNEEIMKHLLEMNENECNQNFDFISLIKKYQNAKIKKPIDLLKESFINKLNDISNNIQKTTKTDLEDIITKNEDQSDLNDKFKTFKLDISQNIENQNYGIIDKSFNDKPINNIFDYKIKIDDQPKNEIVIEKEKVIIKQNSESSSLEDGLSDFGDFGLMDFDNTVLKEIKVEENKGVKLKSVEENKIVIDIKKKSTDAIVVEDIKNIVKEEKSISNEESEDFGILDLPELDDGKIVEKVLEDTKQKILKSASKEDIVINTERKSKSNDIVIKKEDVVIVKDDSSEEKSEDDFGSFSLPEMNDNKIVEKTMDDTKKIILKSASGDKIEIRKNTTKTTIENPKTKTISEQIDEQKTNTKSLTKEDDLIINNEPTKTKTSPKKTVEDKIPTKSKTKKTKTNDIEIKDEIQTIQIKKRSTDSEEEDYGDFDLINVDDKINNITILEDVKKPKIKSSSHEGIEIRNQISKTKTGKSKSVDEGVVIKTLSSLSKTVPDKSFEENIIIKKLSDEEDIIKKQITKTKQSIEKEILIKKETTKSDNIVIGEKTRTIKSKSKNTESKEEEFLPLDLPEVDDKINKPIKLDEVIKPKLKSGSGEKIEIRKKTTKTEKTVEEDDTIKQRTKTGDIEIEKEIIKIKTKSKSNTIEDDNFGTFDLINLDPEIKDNTILEDVRKIVVKTVSDENIKIKIKTKTKSKTKIGSKTEEHESSEEIITDPKHVEEIDTTVIKTKTKSATKTQDKESSEEIVKTATKSKTATKDEPKIQPKTATKDEPKIKSKTATKDEPKIKSKTATKDEPKSKSKTASKDEPKIKSKSKTATSDIDNTILTEDPNKTTLTETTTTTTNIPVGPITITSYTGSTIEENIGITIYALQTSAERLLSADNRSKEEIIEEIEILFQLLPICLQNALLTCKPKNEKLKKRCEDSYNSAGLLCESEHDFKVGLKCSENEELFNDVCYTKCPAGFEDLKLFCKKGNYVKRYVGKGRKERGELVWGELVVEDCKSYGMYYESVGSDYCRMVCPEGWRDYGMLCEKPKRFENQAVFVFSKEDVEE